jgi:hypothetical protein
MSRKNELLQRLIDTVKAETQPQQQQAGMGGVLQRMKAEGRMIPIQQVQGKPKGQGNGNTNQLPA